MMTTMRTYRIAGLLAAALAATPMVGAAQEAPVRTINVTGRGQAQATPDMAMAGFGVSVRRPTAADAYASVARAMNSVVASALTSGIDAEDMRTAELSLGPIYAGGGDSPLRIEAYEARQRLVVTVRDLDRLGAVLDAAARAGATDFDGVTFDVADKSALQDEARRAAVEDAARIAGLLAESAGATLGGPITISMGHSYTPPPMPGVMRAAMEAMPVAPGTLVVTADVSITYAIE
jgi:uncharacterized protein YggE